MEVLAPPQRMVAASSVVLPKNAMELQEQWDKLDSGFAMMGN